MFHYLHNFSSKPQNLCEVGVMECAHFSDGKQCKESFVNIHTHIKLPDEVAGIEKQVICFQSLCPFCSRRKLVKNQMMSQDIAFK